MGMHKIWGCLTHHHFAVIPDYPHPTGPSGPSFLETTENLTPSLDPLETANLQSSTLVVPNSTSVERLLHLP